MLNTVKRWFAGILATALALTVVMAPFVFGLAYVPVVAYVLAYAILGLVVLWVVVCGVGVVWKECFRMSKRLLGIGD